MAFLAENIHHQLTNGRLVFDDENAPGRCCAGLIREWNWHRRLLFGGNGNYRQVDRKVRTHSWNVVDRYFPTVLLHDAVDNRKSEAGPDSERLGGEKRIENPGYDFVGNSRPVVGNFDNDSFFSVPDAIVRANPDV